MSGCFRSKNISDKEALEWLLKHSTISVLSNESSNALVLYVKVKKDDNNPYLRLYFSISKQKIIQEPLNHMIIKLTPLRNEDNKEEKKDEKKEDKILVENQVIYISNHKGWQDEVHLQKYVFYHTYMIDMQMQAICPNVLCSWKILPSQIQYFLSLINISDHRTPIKRKFKNWDYGEIQERLSIDERWKEKKTTHYKTIIEFFNQIYTHNISVGCMLMEYLQDATDMVEYPCVQGYINNDKNLGTNDEYALYLYGKAYGLIQYDKCRSIGVEHDDLHWGNMVTYLTPEGNMATSIIDFGIAHKTTPYSCKRPRSFNSNVKDVIDRIENKPYTDYIRNQYSYLDMLTRTNKKLVEWNDIKRHKIGPNSKRYEYIPINLMNIIDNEMLNRGRIICKYLLEILDIEPQEKITNDELLSLYLIGNKLDENCISLLDPSVPACVTFSSQRIAKTIDDFSKYLKHSKHKKNKHKSAYRFIKS